MDGIFIEGPSSVRSCKSFLLVWSLFYLKGAGLPTAMLEEASRDLTIYLMPIFSMQHANTQFCLGIELRIFLVHSF